MYEELVRKLCECFSGECFNCSQNKIGETRDDCIDKLLHQSADAIEELQKVANKLLAKYQEEATGMIWEHSFHIENSLDNLAEECKKLQAQIDGKTAPPKEEI